MSLASFNVSTEDRSAYQLCVLGAKESKFKKFLFTVVKSQSL